MSIHSQAVIGKSAKIAQDAEIGAYAVIEDGAELGAGVKVWPHAYICGGTTIGERSEVHMGAVVGHYPQDMAFKKDTKSFTRIGKGVVIREHVTIHRGTQEGTATVIGDGCFLMANSHVAHNCQIGSNVIVVNGALLAGYVSVEDGAFISGNVVIHQFCRIGRLAMIGGFSAVNQDVPPYLMVRGPSTVRAINLVGLRRAKYSREAIRAIKDVYKALYLSGMNTTNAMVEVKKYAHMPEIAHFISFVESSKRGICKSKATDEEYFGE